MRVHVKLFSRFRDYLPREMRGETTVELPEGVGIDQLLAHLALTDRVKLVVVNDLPEPDRQRVLHDGDRVHIFPPVAGG